MYDELVKKLRYCGNAVSCLNCPYWEGCEGSKEDLIHAADAIEELSRLHEAQRQNLIALMNEDPEMEWIPVTERLPKEEETVLAWGKLGVVWLDWRHDDKWCCAGGVTHWMPLPEAPKEDET